MDAEAYEVKREEVTNGIFISFLKRRVCEDEKVTVMLDRVAEGTRTGQLKQFLKIVACVCIVGVLRSSVLFLLT